ncbi:type II toxin-antitoxin system VapC family toxin [Candidatus Uhrbacteria bacterium]|nr:type II toxin-antitoxin system VapC family toxin [Candidatus Uhrbacteria bacterium]
MTTAVIDASFVLSFLLPDERILKVDEIFFKHLNEEIAIVAPTLLPFEVANDLKSACLRKRVDRKTGASLLEKFCDLGIRVVPVYVPEVFSLALANGLSFYDASYAWLAQSRGCQLMTHDKKLSKIIKQ